MTRTVIDLCHLSCRPCVYRWAQLVAVADDVACTWRQQVPTPFMYKVTPGRPPPYRRAINVSCVERCVRQKRVDSTHKCTLYARVQIAAATTGGSATIFNSKRDQER